MKRELIIIIAAALMGVAAVVFYQIHVSGIEQQIRSQLEDTTTIVTLAEAVRSRHMLERAVLKKEDVPRAFVHPRAVKWNERKQIYGQRVLYPMQAGQPILWSDLEERSKRSVDNSILPGRAVVTIPIDLVGGVSGLISPGSRVDIFGIFKSLPTNAPEDALPTEAIQGNQIQNLQDLNQLLEQTRQTALSRRSSQLGGFSVVPVARDLGVFAVGSRTRTSGAPTPSAASLGLGQDEGYSTISFDAPAKMQVLLIMAMYKVKTEGGKLICVLRSNQTGGEELLDPGQVFQSQEFLKLISKANAELEEAK